MDSNPRYIKVTSCYFCPYSNSFIMGECSKRPADDCNLEGYGKKNSTEVHPKCPLPMLSEIP